MKKTWILSVCVIVMVAGFAGTAFAEQNLTARITSDSLVDSKPDWQPSGVQARNPMAGGETCATATVIATLPYLDSGTTIGATHDYDEACDYTGGLAGDVVYAYTPATNETVDISVCSNGGDADYDTKIYVYEGLANCGVSDFACNDDSCQAPSYTSAFNSELISLSLTGGNTYYIVVDGYGTDEGNYTLSVDLGIPPPVCDCLGGEVPEGEANCGIPDTYNGGCNQEAVYNPATFTTVSCNTTYCGTTGTADSSRDTDWFLLNMPQVDNVHVTLTAAYPMFIFEIDIPAYDCAAAAVAQDVAVDACVPGTMDFTSVVGDNFIWIGPQLYDGVPCPTDYIMEITCDVVPVGLQSFLIE